MALYDYVNQVNDKDKIQADFTDNAIINQLKSWTMSYDGAFE